MVNSDPLAQPLAVYVAIFCIAIAGGLVGYLNKNAPKEWGQALIVVLTSCFTGFLAFCLCLAREWDMAWTLITVGVVGMMGKRAVSEMEQIVRARIAPGSAPQPPTPEQEAQE